MSLVYKIASRLVARGSTTRNAVVVAFLASAVPALLWALQANLGHGVWQILLEAYLLKLAFSETHILYPCTSAYKSGDCPREVVGQFVRRDLWAVGCGHVASACLETAAESFADSFISPLFWYALLGLPGAWAQRIVNTLDGLIGFKEWGKSGAPAAYLDTALNWIPARIAALFILLAAYLLGHRPDLGALGDRSIESPNARWPISAMAASLGVKLEKPGFYSVGSGELPDRSHVLEGLRLIAVALVLYSVCLFAALQALAGLNF